MRSTSRELGPVEHPQAAQRVLHQVTDDPVGGEELRGGGDVGGFDLGFAADHLVLFFGDVELVEPSNHLDVGAGVGGKGVAHSLHNGDSARAGPRA